MIDAVGQILAERRHPWRQGLSGGLAAAALLHLLILTLALFAAREPPPEPMEYVAVQVVPLQALGSRQPPPAPESAPQESPPRPPEPEPPPPPEPEEEPAPVLPGPDAEPEKPEPRREGPPPRQPAPSGPAAAEGQAGGREGSPLGSPRGFSVVGANRFEGIDPDFAAYDYYLDRMLALIHAQWVRPPTEGEVRAVVRFLVRRDGEIDDVELVEPSGFNTFDLAALRAVRNAGPLPPLPSSYRKESLRVTLIVH